MANVIKTMDAKLADDPWHTLLPGPEWLAALIEAGALGQKAGAGVFRKMGREIKVFDPRRATTAPPTTGLTITSDPGDQGPGAKRPKLLRDEDRRGPSSSGRFIATSVPLLRLPPGRRSPTPHARSTWPCAGATAGSSAPSSSLAGRRLVADRRAWIAGGYRRRQDRCRRGAARLGVRWPVRGGRALGRRLVFCRHGQHEPRPDLPVYQRQMLPERLLGEPQNRGTTVEHRRCASGHSATTSADRQRSRPR